MVVQRCRTLRLFCQAGWASRHRIAGQDDLGSYPVPTSHRDWAPRRSLCVTRRTAPVTVLNSPQTLRSRRAPAPDAACRDLPGRDAVRPTNRKLDLLHVRAELAIANAKGLGKGDIGIYRPRPAARREKVGAVRLSFINVRQIDFRTRSRIPRYRRAVRRNDTETKDRPRANAKSRTAARSRQGRPFCVHDDIDVTLLSYCTAVLTIEAPKIG